MKDKTRLLSEEKMSKTLLVMGIPTMIGMLVAALYNVVDTYFVGRLGTNATAAVSVVYPLSTVGMLVGLFFGGGGNSIIARLVGRKEYEEVKKFSSTAVYCGLATITGLIVLMLVFMDPLLNLLGTLPEYQVMAKEYAVIFVIGLFFNVFNMCMNNLIVAEGNSFVSMVAMLAGAVVNVILDPILIFTFNLGIAGAAYATMASRLLSAVIYSVYVISNKSLLSINPRYFDFKRDRMLELTRIGLPIALFQLVNGIASTMVNKLAKDYGVDAQAAIGIVNKVMYLEMSILYGFFKGFAPVVGYNYGAGNLERVKEATKLGLLWSTGATAICGILMIIFRENLIYIFNKQSTEVIAIGSFALIVYALSYITYGLQMIIGNYFIAIGQAKRGGGLTLGKGILYIGSLLLLNAVFGLNGLVFAQLCSDIIGAIITVVVYLDYKKKAEAESMLCCA